jgi:hypothetical protein
MRHPFRHIVINNGNGITVGVVGLWNILSIFSERTSTQSADIIGFIKNGVFMDRTSTWDRG